MTIKAVLFDKDGTLVDFHKTWMPPCWAAARFFAANDEDLARELMILGGLDPETGRMKSGSLLAAANNHEIVEGWLPLAPFRQTDDRVALVHEVNQIFMVEGLKNAAVVTDLNVLFDKLEAMNCRLGVATMDSEEAALRSLSEFGVKDRLDYIAGYDSGHGSKPGPGMVHGFADKLDLDTSEILVVGDNLHDLHMGRSAGAGMVVGVLTGTSLREDLTADADHVLDSIEGLPELLAG